MRTRLDTRTILSMFNQSKMQAEESFDKDRLAEINRKIEEERLNAQKAQDDRVYKLQADNNASEEILRKAKMAELAFPHAVKGKAKDVFDPVTLRYTKIDPEASVTNEQFTDAVAHGEKMYGLDKQAETSKMMAQMTSTTAAMKAQEAWQLKIDQEKRDKEKAEIGLASSYPTMDVSPVGYKEHPIYNTLGRQNAYNQTVMDRVNQGITRQRAIEASARDPKVLATGANPYALTAAENLSEENFLNSIYDASGNPTQEYKTGSGLGDYFSNTDQDALIQRTKQAVSTLRGYLGKNSTTQMLKLKLPHQ